MHIFIATSTMQASPTPAAGKLLSAACSISTDALQQAQQP